MKRNWLPIMLGIIVAWVIVVEVIDSSRKQTEEDKRYAEYAATEEQDSA